MSVSEVEDRHRLEVADLIRDGVNELRTGAPPSRVVRQATQDAAALAGRQFDEWQSAVRAEG